MPSLNPTNTRRAHNALAGLLAAGSLLVAFVYDDNLTLGGQISWWALALVALGSIITSRVADADMLRYMEFVSVFVAVLPMAQGLGELFGSQAVPASADLSGLDRVLALLLVAVMVAFLAAGYRLYKRPALPTPGTGTTLEETERELEQARQDIESLRGQRRRLVEKLLEASQELGEQRLAKETAEAALSARPDAADEHPAPGWYWRIRRLLALARSQR